MFWSLGAWCSHWNVCSHCCRWFQKCFIYFLSHKTLVLCHLAWAVSRSIFLPFSHKTCNIISHLCIHTVHAHKWTLHPCSCTQVNNPPVLMHTHSPSCMYFYLTEQWPTSCQGKILNILYFHGTKLFYVF